jgi:tripartite-type tricarboxylate transporter receptor subunit TctC
VIAGRVPLMFDIWHSARRYVETGDLKLIASASPDRLPGATNVPTVAESYPGVEVIAFNAIVAPGGTPSPISEKLSADIRAVITGAEFRDKTSNLGIDVYGNSPGELSAWMIKEIARWKDVIQASNIKPE